MRIVRDRFAAVAIFAAALFAFVQSAPCQAAGADLKGKTIRFVVGFGAGGGYDIYSRMLAPYFEKRLGATVVVENQPGAGGVIALNHLVAAPATSLEMSIVNGTSAAMQQLLHWHGVRFDLTKFGYLGLIDSSRWLFLVGPHSPIDTVQDAMKSGKTLSWGGSGKIAATTDGAEFTCRILRLKCKIISDYKGSHAAAMALAQGEMDALYVSETSAYNYVKAGSAKPIVTMSRQRSTLFPDVPAVTEMVKLDKEQQWLLDYRSTLETLGRILVVPPSLPHAELVRLQAVAKDILTDPKIVADANKKKRYIDFIPPAKTKQMVDRILQGVTPEQVAEIRKIVLGN